jgi:hypothetical protein
MAKAILEARLGKPILILAFAATRLADREIGRKDFAQL